MSRAKISFTHNFPADRAAASAAATTAISTRARRVVVAAAAAAVVRWAAAWAEAVAGIKAVASAAVRRRAVRHPSAVAVRRAVKTGGQMVNEGALASSLLFVIVSQSLFYDRTSIPIVIVSKVLLFMPYACFESKNQ